MKKKRYCIKMAAALLCVSCCAIANDTTNLTATIENKGATFKLRWGRGMAELQASTTWTILDISLTNRLIHVQAPSRQGRYKGPAHSLRSDPRLVATIRHLRSGEAHTSRIAVRPKDAFSLGNRRYQVVDIRPHNGEVLLKEYPDGISFLLRTATSEAKSRKSTEPEN